jgi:hypothetical protein
MFEKLKPRIAKIRKKLKKHNKYFHCKWQRQPRFWVCCQEESFANDEKKGPELKVLIQKMEERLKKNMVQITEGIGMHMFGRLFQDLKKVRETYEQMEPLFLQAWDSQPRSEDAWAQYEAESYAFKKLGEEKERLENCMSRKIQWLKLLRSGFSKNYYTSVAEVMHAEMRCERRMQMRPLQPSSSLSPPLP